MYWTCWICFMVCIFGIILAVCLPGCTATADTRMQADLQSVIAAINDDGEETRSAVLEGTANVLDQSKELKSSIQTGLVNKVDQSSSDKWVNRIAVLGLFLAAYPAGHLARKKWWPTGFPFCKGRKKGSIKRGDHQRKQRAS